MNTKEYKYKYKYIKLWSSDKLSRRWILMQCGSASLPSMERRKREKKEIFVFLKLPRGRVVKTKTAEKKKKKGWWDLSAGLKALGGFGTARLRSEVNSGSQRSSKQKERSQLCVWKWDANPHDVWSILPNADLKDWANILVLRPPEQVWDADIPMIEDESSPAAGYQLINTPLFADTRFWVIVLKIRALRRLKQVWKSVSQC